MRHFSFITIVVSFTLHARNILVGHGESAPREIWNIFYTDPFNGDEVVGCYSEGCSIGSKEGESYVYACFFIDMDSGAIVFSDNNIKFLHSSCFFDQCSRNGVGGVINFVCQSSIVQHRFCTINATSNGKFGCHSYTFVTSNKQNIISDCSISLCSNEQDNGLNRMYYGNCGFYSSNSTKNRLEWGPGFYFTNADGPSTFNYSTFVDNNAKYNACIYCASNGIFYGNFCNFKNCTQGRSSYGIIHCNTELIFTDSTVVGPYGNGRAFSTSNNSAIFCIHNCNIDPYSTWSGSYTTSGIIKTGKTRVLSHFISYECHNIINHKFRNEDTEEKIYFHFEVLRAIANNTIFSS